MSKKISIKNQHKTYIKTRKAKNHRYDVVGSKTSFKNE